MNIKDIFSFLIIAIISGCVLFAKNGTAMEATLINSECEIYLDSCFRREIYSQVTEKPKFPGGSTELYKYVAKRLIYTEEELGKNDGKLLVQMIIEKDGSVKQVRLKEACLSEANSLEIKLAEILTKTHNWEPGRCDTEMVATLFELLLVI